jgi:hypothetical protein
MDYQLGTLIDLSATFTKRGVATNCNPTLGVRTPAGVVTLYGEDQLTSTGTGVYEKQVLLSEAGRWEYNWSSDETVVTSSGKQSLDVVGDPALMP